MFDEKAQVSTGLKPLDQRLGGLLIGDNVIWYDEAGSLAFPFTLNFIHESEQRNKPIIYITFDRSPKSLLKELGPLAQDPNLTILDCFTHGKGDGSEIFSKFYQKDGAQWPYQIIKVNEPAKPDKVSEAIYGLHKKLKGDVRFVFESLTGMQDLWEGEESILKFYSRSCPRLYELETIAYWIIEKGAHSNRLKAHINQIAQVAIELSIRRGKSTFSILKAHNRRPDSLDKPEFFWADGLAVSFDIDRPMPEKIDLGRQLKFLRTKQGVSQKELAGLVGVTPSTISQIESNLIYPSLPALIKIAQVMSVDISFFFHQNKEEHRPVLFSGEGNYITFQNMPRGSIEGRQLLPPDLPAGVEPYILKIAPEKKLPSHFFNHKGEEFGYLIEGELEVTIKNTVHIFTAGHIIFLAHDVPTQWKNNTDKKAVLLWMKIK